MVNSRPDSHPNREPLRQALSLPTSPAQSTPPWPSPALMSSTAISRALPMLFASSFKTTQVAKPKGLGTPPQTCSPSPSSSPYVREVHSSRAQAQSLWSSWTLSSTHQQILMAPIKNRSRIRPLLISWRSYWLPNSVSCGSHPHPQVCSRQPLEGAYCTEVSLPSVHQSFPWLSPHLSCKSRLHCVP